MCFFFFFVFFRFFYRCSSALSLVFHSDPAGPLGHLLCRGPSQIPIFVSGSSGIRTHVLVVLMWTSYHYPILTPHTLVHPTHKRFYFIYFVFPLNEPFSLHRVSVRTISCHYIVIMSYTKDERHMRYVCMTLCYR